VSSFELDSLEFPEESPNQTSQSSYFDLRLDDLDDAHDRTDGGAGLAIPIPSQIDVAPVETITSVERYIEAAHNSHVAGVSALQLNERHYDLQLIDLGIDGTSGANQRANSDDLEIGRARDDAKSTLSAAVPAVEKDH